MDVIPLSIKRKRKDSQTFSDYYPIDYPSMIVQNISDDYGDKTYYV